MKHIIVCGGDGAGKSTIVDQLQDETAIDTPGREYFMAGLASAAADADFAVVVIDARRGISDDIYRQCHALTVLGVMDAVFAVSKMDLVDYSQDIFDDIDGKFRKYGELLDLTIHGGVPISLDGGDAMPWYQGPTLPDLLAGIDPAGPDHNGSFRFLVDGVSAGTVTGTLAGGAIAPGESIVVLPSADTAVVDTVRAGDGKTELGLRDGVDVSPGDIICKVDDRAQLSDQFRVKLLWQHEDPLLPSRPYLLKMGERVIAASITDIKHIVNPHTLERDAGKTMRLNDAGACNLALASPIPYDPFKDNQTTGRFTILDRESRHTLATGVIEFGLYRADNIHWQALGIDKLARSEMKNQKPAVLWFTGLSASGKSTVANLVEQKLHRIGQHTYTLDGDNVRHGLNKNLGFTDADRVENIRRVAETSKLMVDAGLICLVSFISPFRAERRMARELLDNREFIEVFVDTPLDICEARDPKGLYKKARAGEIKNFTGFDSPYEPPESAEIILKTADMNPDEAAIRVFDYLQEHGFVGSEEGDRP